MRTTIEIDDRLSRQAMRCAPARTKREIALRLLVKTRAQVGIHRLRGKVRFEQPEQG
jgi:Arc/MetJ family transcription regulator